jgi:plasmid stabilization system protein ParE
MKVEWSDDALADLDRFAKFLRETYPALAERVARELISKAQMLSELPRSGRALAGRQEYRQVVLSVLNARYVFQYRCAGDRLVILRIFHGREARL